MGDGAEHLVCFLLNLRLWLFFKSTMGQHCQWPNWLLSACEVPTQLAVVQP
jgi:hypothetical protein